MPAKRDKTTGLPLPSPVDPGSTICVQLQIPDAPEYRQAFRGFVADLGKWWTWSHTAGQSDNPARDAAELWRIAATTIVYGMCGIDPMSCEDVADCIETNEQTRSAVQSLISEQATPGTQAPPGQRLPDAVWTQNQAVVGDCNPDSFWAQCRKFVDYTVQAGTDFLEEIEVYSNAIEAASFIEAVPVIGTIVDEVQLDQALEFFDWAIEVIAELYAAADNETNRNAIACALFCAYRDECELSLEGVFNVLNERTGNVFTPESLDTLEDLIATATTLITSPTLPLDTWIVFLMAMGRVASYLGVRGIDKTLNLMLTIAADQPNDDWIVLCEDCPEPPPPDPNCEDLTAGVGHWSVDSGNGVYIPGEGFRGLAYGPEYILWAVRANTTGVANKIVYHFNAPTTNVFLYRNGIPFLYYDGTPTTAVEFSAATFPGTWANVDLSSGIGLRSNFGEAPGRRFVEACVYLV